MKPYDPPMRDVPHGAPLYMAELVTLHNYVSLTPRYERAKAEADAAHLRRNARPGYVTVRIRVLSRDQANEMAARKHKERS